MPSSAGTLFGIAVALALVGATRGAAAQPVDDALDDVGRFRAALGDTLYANLTCDGGPVTTAAIRAGSAGLVWDGGSLQMDDAAAAWPARLLAVALATGDADESAASLGVPLVRQWLSYEVLADADAPVLVRRIGSARFNVAIEPGVARPREWRVTLDGTRWTVRITSMLDVASEWYPATVVVFQDDVRLYACEITDASRSAGALAPLAPSAPSATTRDLAMPRLPL